MLDALGAQAANDVAWSALNVLRCNAAELYIYDQKAQEYRSAVCASARGDLASGSTLTLAEVDALLPAGLDRCATEDLHMLPPDMYKAGQRMRAFALLMLRLDRGARRLGLLLCAYGPERAAHIADEHTSAGFSRLAAATLAVTANSATTPPGEPKIESVSAESSSSENGSDFLPDRRSTTELAVLHRLAMLAISEPQLEAVLQAVSSEAVSTFGCDAACIALEQEQGDFRLVSAHGLSAAYLQQRVIPGPVFRSLCGDPPKEAFLDGAEIKGIGQAELVEAEGISNLFMVPLLHQGKLFGALGLIGLRQRLRFSTSQQRLAQLFADQAAIAITRAQASQALNERIEDYDFVALVGHAMVSRLNPDYGSILNSLGAQLGHRHLALFTKEKDVPRLVCRAQSGYPADMLLDFPNDGNMLGEVASSGEMVYIPDVSLDPRYVRSLPDIRSQIAYPLKFGGEVLGVLSLESARSAAFDARDRRILSAFADQCAISLSNAAQFATASRRLRSLADAQVQLEKYATYLERRQSELKLINSVSGAAASTLNLETMLQTVVKLVAEGLHTERCSIGIANEEQTVVETAAEYRSDDRPSSVGARMPIERDSALAEIFTRRRSIVSDDMQSDPRFVASRSQLMDQGLRSGVIVPLVTDARAIGSISVNATLDGRRFSAEDVAVLETVANQVAMGIRNARLYGRARDRANEDSLTGLANHRHLHERLENELARSRRASHPLAIVLFDLNNFKMFNDNYGHQAGDEVLRTVATTLMLCLRSTDIAARYGGDEFLVILPQADEAGARLLLERVNHKLDDQARAGFPPVPIAISAGVAVFPRDGDNKSALIAFADENMYAQKREFRQKRA